MVRFESAFQAANVLCTRHRPTVWSSQRQLFPGIDDLPNTINTLIDHSTNAMHHTHIPATDISTVSSSPISSFLSHSNLLSLATDNMQTDSLSPSSLTDIIDVPDALKQREMLLADTNTPSDILDIPNTMQQQVVGTDTTTFDESTEEALSAIGKDLLLFLAACVVVAPLSKVLNISSVLLFLIFGCIAGPHGLSLMGVGETQFDAEIGDFGILFLLFVEGLNLSPERLKALGSFFSLGATQLLLSVGAIFFIFFFGGPYLFQVVANPNIPIDPSVIYLLEKPVVAFSIAAAGALSSSAFVLPILKEKGWAERPDGIAALSILLLQDLAVAPLLVLLPLIADYQKSGGSMMEDPSGLLLLAAKATIGFGSVLAVASLLLRRIFQVVASTGSSQTFVAASLLVAIGMGTVADNLGLSSTTGAFAAGVLLAESGYRAQIEADIKPFEGILLGVFFITAGASLDPAICIEYWPTLVAGIISFLAVKFGILFAAGEFALGLTRADSTRVALLLAGGGEFAFVVFNLAEKLDVLPETLGSLLTASVIISMSLTPLLGELAEWGGNKLDEQDTTSLSFEKSSASGTNGANGSSTSEYDVNLTDENRIREAFEMFDEDGNGSISVDELQKILVKPGTSDENMSYAEVKALISQFDDNGDGELQYNEFAELWTAKRRTVITRKGKLKPSGSSDSTSKSLSRAIVVCGYGEVAQQLCANLDSGLMGGRTYVAFDRDPGRISVGVVNGARVVYGDGASSSLLRAAGVEDPSTIVITYPGKAQCLDATIRLRDSYPNVPIYVRALRQDWVDQLMKAGATDVIVASRGVADGFCNVLGVRKDSRPTVMISSRADSDDDLVRIETETETVESREQKYWSSLRSLVKTKEQGEEMKTEGGGELPPGLSEDDLMEILDYSKFDRQELLQLYKLFSTSFDRNEDGEVQLAELRNEVMRMSDKPIDDETLATWMGYDEALSKWVTGDAETTWVSFADFVQFCSSLRSSSKEDGNDPISILLSCDSEYCY